MVRVFIQCFRFVPFPVIYLLSDLMAFVLHRVIGYRKKVIWENLRRAFPEKTETALKKIVKETYRNLTDVTLESIKVFTMSFKELERRCPCNPELVNKYLDRGQAVILAGCHLGNWEYTGQTMAPTFHGTTYTAYKPLTNKKMDAYLNNARSRQGMVLIAMDDMFRVFRGKAKEPAVFLLLSDQSPSSRKSAHWVSFFGQETASLPGTDVLARKFGLPVLYYVCTRIKRGFYKIEIRELFPDPSSASEQDITRSYTEMLEADIRQQPEQWLWSHKRWKMKREEA